MIWPIISSKEHTKSVMSRFAGHPGMDSRFRGNDIEVRMSLLQMIKSPKDLKAIKKELLPQICKDVREKILDVVSRKGGHLGASLGATEITVALHYVFDTPKDQIVWDTGHQAYGHKLLTGRQDRFETIRQHHGLSGFLSRKES